MGKQISIDQNYANLVGTEVLALLNQQARFEVNASLLPGEIAVLAMPMEAKFVKSGFRKSSSDRVGFGSYRRLGGGAGFNLPVRYSGYAHRWGRSGPAQDQFVTSGRGEVILTNKRLMFFGSLANFEYQLASISRADWVTSSFLTPGCVQIFVTHEKSPFQLANRDLSQVQRLYVSLKTVLNPPTVQQLPNQPSTIPVRKWWIP